MKRGNKENAIAQGMVCEWIRLKFSDESGLGGRGNPFPYIHFTMQKTNRDTQDALSYLSRLLHVPVKDLSVSGTKDKRGVTVQRVSFKRNGKTIQDVWKTLNRVTGRLTAYQANAERGERGIRIGDLTYRKGFLELGMLKGNEFVITLRYVTITFLRSGRPIERLHSNVRVDSTETMERALNSLKQNGFINYYGTLQRLAGSR